MLFGFQVIFFKHELLMNTGLPRIRLTELESRILPSDSFIHFIEDEYAATAAAAWCAAVGAGVA